MIDFVAEEARAQRLDAEDPLAEWRPRFHLPPRGGEGGGNSIYLCGNSLGLQPKSARAYVEEELEDWARLGVEGHLHARHPWLHYHELLAAQSARLVGALPGEVVMMNTLTVNLHLMMVSFYRPTTERYKILVEAGAFPSDQYAVASQIAYHGYDPRHALVEVAPRPGENSLRDEDIDEILERQGEAIALVLLGGVNYYSGQAFDLARVTRAARARGCTVGFDLAHAAGNLVLALHDWDADFAVWCSYKYLNGGPGATGGCFVHERHARNRELPRFAGWWGHDKASRFKMPATFDPIPGAEGWQLSNPPILPMASLRASLEIFDAVGMAALRAKSERLTGYLESLIDRIPGGAFEIITPRQPARRGAQLSIRARADGRRLFERLNAAGVVCDWREPDVIRVAPAPLYNSFSDVQAFAAILAAPSGLA